MLASASPADVLLQPIFNPVGGYASYIVPAAFVLILQQMLLIGASLLTVVALAQPTGGAFAAAAAVLVVAALAQARAAASRLMRAQLPFESLALPCPFGFPSLGLHDSFSAVAKADQPVANRAQGRPRSAARLSSPPGSSRPATPLSGCKQKIGR